MFRSLRKRPVDPELDDLDEARHQIDSRIAELENLPKQIELELLDRESTLPPPDDSDFRARQRRFEERAARREIRNERRTQGRSLTLLVMLMCACFALASWALKLAAA